MDTLTSAVVPDPAGPAARPPRIAALLGYGGLLPFGALALLLALGGAHSARWWPMLLAYGAVILSFVGALHWGFAMALPGLGAVERQRLYGWSVVPALAAWPALLWAAPAAALLLVAGFGAHYAQDRRLLVAHGVVAKVIRALTMAGFDDFFEWQLANGAVLEVSLACGDAGGPLVFFARPGSKHGVAALN